MALISLWHHKRYVGSTMTHLGSRPPLGRLHLFFFFFHGGVGERRGSQKRAPGGAFSTRCRGNSDARVSAVSQPTGAGPRPPSVPSTCFNLRASCSSSLLLMFTCVVRTFALQTAPFTTHFLLHRVVLWEATIFRCADAVFRSLLYFTPSVSTSNFSSH